ncbi:MAG: Eco57I restriction-modification methylase domain-containing protein [Bacteroidales bacterium]|nr:Eco57I restriction-modification methylase domain-containing protein [Bacteroidales bacterium]
MSSSNNRYGLRRSGGQHGDVFTSPEVVSYMLDLVGYTADKDLSKVKILEPSCGEGEFVLEIVRRLRDSSRRYGFDFGKALLDNVFAYDIDEKKIETCKARLAQDDIHVSLDANIRQGDFLTQQIPAVDVVVGNPPYIRYEQIPQDQLSNYKQLFHTFHYRADLYILFFEKTLRSLRPGGRHCFICSNRWLKNEYGKKLRAWIAESFCLQTILSLEKAPDAFQEEVLAFPAITLISNASPAASFTFAEVTSIQQLENVRGKKLPSPQSSDWSGVFNSIGSDDTLLTIEEMGFMVGIGVATGADSIFIAKDLPGRVEKELLLPALNARDMSGNRLHWSGKYLLNPYKPNGELISLDDFPMAAEYLLFHREALQNRYVARKNPGKWYKTIDRIVPSLKDSPKILLPDISGNQLIFVDEGKYYPQHNLYYITGGTIRQLQLLSALLMSDYVKNQLLNITNCMNGGYPRWQSQYLRKLLMPDINAIKEDLANRLLSAYHKFDLNSLNDVVDTIVSYPRQKSLRKRTSVHQLEFDFSI